MNTDILTLYAPQMLAGITAVAVLLMGANIFQAMKVMVMHADLDGMDERNTSIIRELTDERVKREQADMLNETLLDEVIATRRCVDSLRDELGEFRGVNDTLKIHNDAMKAERANLYRRNAKGHFEAVVPQKPKPHTLRHGMTVKNPSAYQAKRIFADAKRAGMDWDTADNMEGMSPTSDIIFWPYQWNGEKNDCVINRPRSYRPTTYISAREFRRRIKGEIP
jgi:hypothetical protein